MLEYKENVINALPKMLTQETKGKASVTISSYMNAMLRIISSEGDLKVFAETLQCCKNFAVQNGLNGLLKACIQWNHEGILKLNSIRGIKQTAQTQQNENVQQVAVQIVQKLSQLQGIVNQDSNIDTNVLETVKPQLDQIEIILQTQGSQLFQPQQLEIVRREISQLRENLRVKFAVIDDLLDTNHILGR